MHHNDYISQCFMRRYLPKDNWNLYVITRINFVSIHTCIHTHAYWLVLLTRNTYIHTLINNYMQFTHAYIYIHIMLLIPIDDWSYSDTFYVRNYTHTHLYFQQLWTQVRTHQGKPIEHSGPTWNPFNITDNMVPKDFSGSQN